MTQQYDPSVDLTIFPRINFIVDFNDRADQRDVNGRIYKWHRSASIDDPYVYPPAEGSDCLDGLLPFPIDLGPDVITPPTGLFDLRENCGVLSIYDLNPLNPPT